MAGVDGVCALIYTEISERDGSSGRKLVEIGAHVKNISLYSSQEAEARIGNKKRSGWVGRAGGVVK